MWIAKKIKNATFLLDSMRTFPVNGKKGMRVMD